MHDDDVEACIAYFFQNVFGEKDDHALVVLFDRMRYVMLRAKTDKEALEKATRVFRAWCDECTYDGVSMLPNGVHTSNKLR